MANNRTAPILLNKETFKKAGYQLIDSLSDFFESIYDRPVTAGLYPKELREIIPARSLPESGAEVSQLLENTAATLMQYSLFNGHPKFMAYITSSPAPLGALADMLASAMNPNVGAQILSPVATEIEKQTIQWLAELIGLSPTYGGILVSGGNMANFTGYLAGIRAKIPKPDSGHLPLKEETIYTIYCCKATHTWIEKAANLFVPQNKILRWIPADDQNRMMIDVLRETLEEDVANGYEPLMIAGTAGDVSTGAVDDFKGIAALAKKYQAWFHIDGAYGIPAAVLPELKDLFAGVEEADSIALDPHKWLYNPLEAGCTLVKNPQHLTDAFSSHPVYYNFDSSEELPFQNFYEYGLQNSRGFRALKVWLILQQVGRSGYEEMIREDIRLSKLLYVLAGKHPSFEAITQSLSLTTFRYTASHIKLQEEAKEKYLNELNEALLNKLQKEGKVFLSNAVINGKYCLRSCIVNFRTSEKDIEEIIDIIEDAGRALADERK